jgi:hypothetical protein
MPRGKGMDLFVFRGNLYIWALLPIRDENGVFKLALANTTAGAGP